MRLNSRRLLCPVAFFVLMVVGPTIAPAGDCAFLNRDPLSLRDGQLLYRPPGAREWSEFTSGLGQLANQTFDFAYVIQEKISQSRSGVAILKSGRLRSPSDPPEQPLELKRNTENADPAECVVPPSMSTKVSAKSYDDYHDRGLSVPDQSALDSFHYKYAGFRYNGARSYGSCKKTDSALRDARSRRSNRMQFSFDAAVVRGLSNTELESYFSLNRAVAATPGRFDNRRVEMQAYRVKAGLPSCLRFTLAIPPGAVFLRINDLEGLQRDERYYVRSDEVEWELAR
ncbi:hypothetical protein [Bradyrhizobium cosmicum]|uniref:hypothetical protein n=1 Tax=Bradyrhizobium cosmicum TaxID=1404864 RepID=UPI0028EDE44E|nr:hypothetical protein [Bradyrhizobium cosmicum]